MGASNLWNLMDAADPAQVLKCECKDKDALTISREGGQGRRAVPALPVGDGPERQAVSRPQELQRPMGARRRCSNLGGWFWESGFDKDMINDIERIRDLNFRAMYGAWDALKNVDQLYPNHRLGWAAFIAGKRESRRLLGDVILTGDDFRKGTRVPRRLLSRARGTSTSTRRTPTSTKATKGDEFISTATDGEGLHATKARTGRRIAASTAATSPTSSWPAATSA